MSNTYEMAHTLTIRFLGYSGYRLIDGSLKLGKKHYMVMSYKGYVCILHEMVKPENRDGLSKLK